MAPNTDPFTPHAPLERAQLERYAQGLLSPEECHEVELHLERDPLLRDALDGLMAPGALEAARKLRRPAPAGGKGRWLTGALAGAALIGAALFLAWPTEQGPVQPEAPKVSADGGRPATLSDVVPAAVESTLKVVDKELETLAVEPEQALPPATVENFRPAPEPARHSLERMEPQPAVIGNRTDASRTPAPERHPRPSRQLVFLHGLKVVHPSELPRPTGIRPGSPGRAADEGQARRDQLPAEPSHRPYLELMDEALQAFAEGRYRRALDDLYFILGQDPADVNAQFYAGLACYHLRLYPRAMRLLDLAAANPVDSFNEEAAWYKALTLERQEGREAARPAFERIASGGGFYAEQAQGRLVP